MQASRAAPALPAFPSGAEAETPRAELLLDYHHYHLFKRVPTKAAHLPNRGASLNSHCKQGQGLEIKKNQALRKQTPPRPYL